MNESEKNRNLTRSRDDRFIGGVAAGIANHLNIDPAIVRIAFVVSVIFGGIGVLAYLILLAAVPIEGDPEVPAPRLDGTRRRWAIGGTVAMGILALVSMAIGGGFGSWLFGFAQGFWFGSLLWVLVIAGLIWLVREAKVGESTTGEAAGSNLPDSGRPAPTSTVTTTLAPSPTQNAPTPPVAPKAASGTTEGEAPTAALAADGATTGTPLAAETKVQPAPTPSSDVPSTFGRVMTILAIIAAAGFTALILASISLLSTTVLGAIPMASVVIVLGIGLVAAALNNRHQLALWTLGAAVAIAIPMAVVSIADLRIEGDYGEVRERPVVAGDIPGDGYHLAAGAMTIDMRDYPFRDAQTVDLPIKSGLGATRVIVPDDVCVSGALRTKAGLTEVRGQQTSGIGFDRTFGDDISQAPVLNVDSEVKVGLFLVVDETTFEEAGELATQDDGWDGTIDSPQLQDEARNRALKACGYATRNLEPPPSAPAKPSGPEKPDATSEPAAKGSA